MLTVRDSGTGMTKRVRERAVEPFFTTREDEGGTGLGLAICRQIVRGYHGDLVVDSKPDEGATFVITIPLATPARQEGDEPQEGR